jgi:chloramphenicol-sensitive protein RarD
VTSTSRPAASLTAPPVPAPAASSSDLDRGGVGLGAAAYVLWGLVPLYWPLLAPAAPVEVLAHRILWTLVFMAVVLAVVGGWRAIRVLSGRGWAMITAASALIAVNWGLFIYAVSIDHVLEVALGYYVGPLVSVLLGVLVLRERPGRLQWLALGIAAAAVVVIALGDARVPWLGLGLAFSFSTYGLIKKTVPLPATASLTAEGVVLAPLAAAYLVALQVAGTGTLVGHGAGHVAWLVSSGPVTAVPLLLYGASARRIPLTTLGTLQYIGPTLQFVLGVVVFGEVMPLDRWVGFGLVWLALLIFTVDLLHPGARRPGPAAVAAR